MQHIASSILHPHLTTDSTLHVIATVSNPAARKYRERWQILVDNKYDPDTDLRRDEQGVLQLVGKPALENEIRKYNRMRNEDSIDE